MALCVLLLDQISKYLVLSEVTRTYDLISISEMRAISQQGVIFWYEPLAGFLNLVLVWNRGVSFGLFESNDLRWFLISFTTLISVLLLIWLVRVKSYLLAVGLGLVIGGAVGNLSDRLWHGAVVDFVDFHLYDWHWPAFNVADSAICIGVGFLLWDSFFGEPASSL